MQKVYTSQSSAKAQVAKDLLAENGIQAMVQRETFSIFGRSYSKYAWPSVWVGEADAAAARELLKDFDAPKKSAGDWVCPHCGEIIGGQFRACWHCAATAELTETPAGEPEKILRARRGLFSALLVAACGGVAAALGSTPHILPGLAGNLLARFQAVALLVFVVGGVLSLHFVTLVFEAEEEERAEELESPEKRRGGGKLAKVRREVWLALLLLMASPMLAELSQNLWGAPDRGLFLGLGLSFYYLIKVIRALWAK
jgi:hypothetical protein